MARIFSRHIFKFTPSSLPSLCSNFSSSKFTNTNFNQDFTEKVINFLDSCQTLTYLYPIQAHLITTGLFKNPSFSGRLLKSSSSLCDISYTLLVFKSMEFYDTFCVNTVIKALSCSSIPHYSIVFYFEMLKNGIFPNSYTFPPLISACAKMGCLEVGEKCHGQIVKNGVDGVLYVQNSLIHLYACCGLIDVAKQVFAEMLVRDLVSWNTLLDGFCKAGETEIAHRLFDAMPNKNIISWNTMITGYLNLGKPGNGLKLFREMVKMGYKRSDTTIVSTITACARSARLKEGKSIHGALIRENINFSLIISTTFIDMYSKCGRVDIARVIFDKMSTKNLISWNAMILGHCIHGNPVNGLCLFTKMEEDKISPNEITFIGVLCACAREGLLTEGRKYLYEMKFIFHVDPNFAHYWCMANLYAKVGLTQEAIEMLRNIGNEDSDCSKWAGLFGSSRFEGEVKRGELVVKELIEEDPENLLNYAILMNIYAVAGRWEDVAQTKEMMKEKGIKKFPDSSLKELKEIVHDTKSVLRR